MKAYINGTNGKQLRIGVISGKPQKQPNWLVDYNSTLIHEGKIVKVEPYKPHLYNNANEIYVITKTGAKKRFIEKDGETRLVGVW